VPPKPSAQENVNSPSFARALGGKNSVQIGVSTERRARGVGRADRPLTLAFFLIQGEARDGARPSQAALSSQHYSFGFCLRSRGVPG